ncbi:hypothetical protein HOL82_03520 [Candidatus Woesearchaeota archaeon]|nr:hypothetical protein [Candidatus Woesearchaeota archaeon]
MLTEIVSVDWGLLKSYKDCSKIRRANMQDGEGSVNLGAHAIVRVSDRGGALAQNQVSGVKFWVPLSVIHEDSEVWQADQEPGDLLVKEWWAEREGHA